MEAGRWREYKEFYERREDYSLGTLESDIFYKEVLGAIKDFNLKDGRILEIGSGNGTMQDVVNDYTGLDVAESLRKFYKKPYVIIGEDGVYPFADASFDFIFTHAVFEHVPEIDFALAEMLRVLKKPGYIVFSVAWQVRSWAADGYAVRPYSDFGVWGRLKKFSLFVRKSILFRLMYVVPLRLFRTVRYLLNKSAMTKLDYVKLKPNYTRMWDADSDACNHIDPHAAILYFFAHNIRVVNYPNLFKAFFVRTGSLVLKK